MTLHLTAPALDVTDALLADCFGGSRAQAARTYRLPLTDVARIVREARRDGWHDAASFARLRDRRLAEGLRMRPSLYFASKTSGPEG